MLEIKVAKLEATQNMGAHIFNAFVGGLSHHGPNVPPMPSMRTPGTSATAHLPAGYNVSPAAFTIEPTDP